jgi:hypothetical protein
MHTKLATYFRRFSNEVIMRMITSIRLRHIDRKNPILVYQMGKVGSTSVVRWLTGAVCNPVIQVHILNERNLRHGIAVTRHSREVFLPEHLILSLHLVRKLRRGIFPCRIITLTRDPVERTLSFVFENRHRKLPDLYKYCGDNAVNYVCEQVRAILSSDNPHSDPTKWFRGELETVFGIDVFRFPYDFETGFRIIEHSVHPVLVMRVEDLTRSFRNAMEAFLGITRDDWPTRSLANVGADKQYGDVLREVKSRLKLSQELLTRVYSTQYAKHFYLPDISSLYERWSEHSVGKALHG